MALLAPLARYWHIVSTIGKLLARFFPDISKIINALILLTIIIKLVKS